MNKFPDSLAVTVNRELLFIRMVVLVLGLLFFRQNKWVVLLFAGHSYPWSGVFPPS